MDYSGIEFPVTIKQFNKIEKQNKININVFGYEEKQPYPVYVSKEKYEDHMNLLLITGESEEFQFGKPSDEDYRLGLVTQTFTDVDGRDSFRKKVHTDHYTLIKDFNQFMYNQTKHKERKHFCMNCLQCFSSERVLTNHKENCIQVNGTQAIEMPKVHGCQPNDNKSYTEAYRKHTDCGYGYKVVCCYDDKYTKPLQGYRGENC